MTVSSQLFPPARLPSRSPACRWLAVAGVALLPQLVHAQLAGISDPVGDFLPTFAGSSASADLDVVSAVVTYNASTDVFTFSSTMAGAIGLTPTGFYVWGVNSGAGTAAFAANGLPGILFDKVLLLRPNGSGSIGANTLPVGAVTITGNTITGVVSGALLASAGFAKPNYTFNLWPRDSAAGTGFAQISDFAPNGVNFTAVPVPEPGSLALLAAGLGVVAWRQRAVGRRQG